MGRIRARYLRHVSPIPPLEPCVRLSPHTAHERGTFMVTSISPGFHHVHGVQLARSLGSLSRFPTLSLRAFAMHVAFPHSDYYAPSDCLQGLGVSLGISSLLLSTLLRIPFRLSRVHYGGRKQDDVGGALSMVPSALCGSPDVAWGTGRLTHALFHWAYGITRCRAYCCRIDRVCLSGWHHRQGMPGS